MCAVREPVGVNPGREYIRPQDITHIQDNMHNWAVPDVIGGQRNPVLYSMQYFQTSKQTDFPLKYTSCKLWTTVSIAHHFGPFWYVLKPFLSC